VKIINTLTNTKAILFWQEYIDDSYILSVQTTNLENSVLLLEQIFMAKFIITQLQSLIPEQDKLCQFIQIPFDADDYEDEFEEEDEDEPADTYCCSNCDTHFIDLDADLEDGFKYCPLCGYKISEYIGLNEMV